MSIKNIKIGIVIPFRDQEANNKRTAELNEFVEYMESYLAGYDYKIFVIEQTNDGRKFNRGQLLNIGFDLARKENFDTFIFHDVDLLPTEELKYFYVNAPTDSPVHICPAGERLSGSNHPRYGFGDSFEFFGGICAFNQQMFEQINGFPNDFWGWGGEDEELLRRTKLFYKVVRPQEGTVRDLENLTYDQKFNLLRTNNSYCDDWNCWQQNTDFLNKQIENQHINGLNQIINADIKKINHITEKNYTIYTVELRDFNL